MSEKLSVNEEHVSDNSDWGEDYSKDIPEFSGEKKFIKLEDIASLCKLDNVVISGHGTASAGDGHEVVERIFEEGIKGYESLGNMISEDRADEVVGSTDITDNTVGLWSSMEGELDFSEMRKMLDNWPHRNAENVILMRLPLEYYNYSDNLEERTMAYFTEHKDKQGQATNYIDRRLIIGNYNAKTGQVELNPNFEPEISDGFKVELDERFERAKEQTKKRHERVKRSSIVGAYGKDNEEENNLADKIDWGDF